MAIDSRRFRRVCRPIHVFFVPFTIHVFVDLFPGLSIDSQFSIELKSIESLSITSRRSNRHPPHPLERRAVPVVSSRSLRRQSTAEDEKSGESEENLTAATPGEPDEGAGGGGGWAPSRGGGVGWNRERRRRRRRGAPRAEPKKTGVAAMARGLGLGRSLGRDR